MVLPWFSYILASIHGSFETQVRLPMLVASGTVAGKSASGMFVSLARF